MTPEELAIHDALQSHEWKKFSTEELEALKKEGDDYRAMFPRLICIHCGLQIYVTGESCQIPGRYWQSSAGETISLRLHNKVFPDSPIAAERETRCERGDSPGKEKSRD